MTFLLSKFCSYNQNVQSKCSIIFPYKRPFSGFFLLQKFLLVSHISAMRTSLSQSQNLITSLYTSNSSHNRSSIDPPNAVCRFLFFSDFNIESIKHAALQNWSTAQCPDSNWFGEILKAGCQIVILSWHSSQTSEFWKPVAGQ